MVAQQARTDKVAYLIEVHENRIQDLQAKIRAIGTGPQSQTKRDQLEARIESERDAIDRIRAAGKAEEERKRKLSADREIERERLEAEFDTDLRATFFAAVPGATEADFIAAKPNLLAQAIKDRQEAMATDAEKAIQRLVPGAVILD